MFFRPLIFGLTSGYLQNDVQFVNIFAIFQLAIQVEVVN